MNNPRKSAHRAARALERANNFNIRRNPIPARVGISAAKTDGRQFFALKMKMATWIQNGLVSAL